MRKEIIVLLMSLFCRLCLNQPLHIRTDFRRKQSGLGEKKALQVIHIHLDNCNRLFHCFNSLCDDLLIPLMGIGYNIFQNLLLIAVQMDVPDDRVINLNIPG